jgi:hypothetical protein
MNFFGVHDPTTAWALLTFLALPPLLLAFYVTMRVIARRAVNARWEDARRELDDDDPEVLRTAVALEIARGLVASGADHEVRALAGCYKGIPVALVLARRPIVGDAVARIVALPPGKSPILERVNAHDFPPRDLARRLDKWLARAPRVERS